MLCRAHTARGQSVNKEHHHEPALPPCPDGQGPPSQHPLNLKLVISALMSPSILTVAGVGGARAPRSPFADAE